MTVLNCTEKSCHVPPPPPLPAFHVWEAPPSTNTGKDFAGPLYIKNCGGGQSKVWIALYTCCITRAFHLEFVPDMSDPAFTQSFKRFSSRRGLLAMILSDNGKPSKRQPRRSRVLCPVQKSRDILVELVLIGGSMSPEHYGWEVYSKRLICSTKHCLRKILE